MGSSGIVLNPDKLQFCQRSVDFAGFRVSEEAIKPLPKYIDAIKNFPIPKNLTDIKSWFGLVNQVSNYNQLRDAMAPFRPLLSPKSKFIWTEELDRSFRLSRQLIVDLIEEGVRIFDIDRETCLRVDWSKTGIGYFFMQKHCPCSKVTPLCCDIGWKITLAGSRFLTGAETRYAAIEGEALAIAWALEQTRYFTQGCNNLLVATDHKPLVKLFNDKTLDEISNTRLFRLKQRTLPWSFEVQHVPGKMNNAADAASRHPYEGSDVNSFSVADLHEQLIASSIYSSVEDISTISWKEISSATSNDEVLSELAVAINEAFCGSYPLCRPFMRYRDSLYIQDGVVMMDDRVVIPKSLQKRVLVTLHSAHQGVATMLRRAQGIMYWPGMCEDIHRIRLQCGECNANAPSQPSMPAQSMTLPLTPFEQIFADFFFLRRP